MTARILDCTISEYHEDPCDVPSLSSSIAHILINKSPAHAWLAHPRMGGEKGNEPTKAMLAGTVMHKLLLGKGSHICVIDAGDYKTNASKSARDYAIEAGEIPILSKDMADLQIASVEIRRNLDNSGVFLHRDNSEVPIEWTDDGVVCRSMFDSYSRSERIVYDLKTTSDASPRSLGRKVVDMGYDIQAHAYTRALEELTGEPGRVEFKWVFCELEPPYSVTVCSPGASLRELGRVRWSKARDVWRECLRTNEWPSNYSADPVKLQAPPWAMAEMMEW